jgi:hypothetical protein
MSDEDKSRSWWQTLPGIITGLTAMMTALGGLVVAVKQTGWLDRPKPPAVVAPAPTAPATRSTPPASAPAPQTPTGPSAPASPGRVDEREAATSLMRAPGVPYAVSLPVMRDYTLGLADTKATFTLLKAEVAQQTAEKDALQIRIRMMNHNRFDANFWSQSFRLIVEGVPMAPDNSLNELVHAQSAKDGDVVFVIPRGTTHVKLAITYLEARTDIPLELAHPR